jgi:hydroxyacylglutathione hydrolase
LARPEIVCLTNGAFAENCYLVADGDTGDAVIVDPGEEVGLFLRRLATEQWTLRAVWLTHAHLDHIAGVAEVVRATGVETYLHPDDRRLYDGVVDQGKWLGVEVEAPPAPDHPLAHGDTVGVGDCAFTVAHTPGHSPGSVTFLGHGVAIVGDVLFAGSVGRVDLPGGDGPTLSKSIEEALMSLPDDTVVYPGHGPATTIGQERITNPFVTGVYPLV